MYSLKDIERIEQTSEYKELREKADIRRKKIAETKKRKEEIEREETVKMVDNFSISVERIPLEELRERTLKAKDEWYHIHPPYKKIFIEFLFPEEEIVEAEYLGDKYTNSGYYDYMYFDYDVYNAPQDVIDRWIVNYIRHNLSEYDMERRKLAGRIGQGEAHKKYKYNLSEEMKKTYPELENEINKYMIGDETAEN